MKFATVSAALAAIIGVSAIASPVLAQGYDDYGQGRAAYDCQVTKHQSQATGGILGALAGAVIGSNLAHGGGRTGGALLGAAAGAAVGSNIGVSSAHNTGACQAANQDYGYGQVRYVYGDGYRYDRYAQYRQNQYREAQYREAQYREAQYRDAQYRDAQYRDAQYRGYYGY